MFLTETTTTTPTINWQDLLNTVINWCMTTGIKLIIGLILMIILFKITNFFTKKLYKKMKVKNVDETISRTLTSTIKVVAKGLILLCFIGYVGIETASITALITSCGVALGLALQGALSNLAGGIIIVLMRPFRIGDYIFTNGESGTVEDIHMFYTTLVTPDNRVVHVPNGTLANNVIVNNSIKDKRRLDIILPVDKDVDLEQVKQIVNNVCDKNELIHKDPKPAVIINAYTAYSVEISIRMWVNNGDYWPVRFALLQEFKETFEANGIKIAFNQMEVSIKNQ